MDKDKIARLEKTLTLAAETLKEHDLRLKALEVALEAVVSGIAIEDLPGALRASEDGSRRVNAPDIVVSFLRTMRERASRVG